MIILIAGTTHTGKTALAQKLMEKYKIPYFSVDHLKMGLIRSGQTALTPCDDEELKPYLWNIVREMIKTAIENGQSLIVEGCYIPFDWKKDFGEEYLAQIKYRCLVMTRNYIENFYSDVIKHRGVIENRAADAPPSKEQLIEENAKALRLLKQFNLDYILIDKAYNVDLTL